MRETIHTALTRKLGREPTHAELKAEVKRILQEVLIKRAGERNRETTRHA